MYICIDESGVQNPQKNNYFVISGFICKNVTKIRSIHRKIEKELRQNNSKLTNKPELKACDLNSTEKSKFINKILEVDGVFLFCICYDLRNKTLMKKLKQNEDKFNFLIKLVLDNLFEKLNDPIYNGKFDYIKNGELKIRLDNRNVKNSYVDKLEDYLIKHSHFSYKHNIDIKECTYHDSKKTREIQMADYIANIFWTVKNYPKTATVIKQIADWNKSSFLWEYSKNVTVMKKPNFKINKKDVILICNNSFELNLWIHFKKIGVNKNNILQMFRNYTGTYEIQDDSNNYFSFKNKHWEVLINPQDSYLIITGVKRKIQNMLNDLKIDIDIEQLIKNKKI